MINSILYKKTLIGDASDPKNALRYYDDNGEYHRLDGPAWILGDQWQWAMHGLVHRIDGPAICWGNELRDDPSSHESHSWYLYGFNVTRQVVEWAEERDLDLLNLKDEDQIAFIFEMTRLAGLAR
jgi:hypothetical protein